MRRYIVAGLVAGVMAAAGIGAVSASYFSSSNDIVQALQGCMSNTPSNLPGAVPSPYNGIFTAAAAQWRVDPALVAAIFMSEHGNAWPDPNSAQATSPVGAMGWFQFMPGTWAGYSNSNPNNPSGDPQNLTDAAYAAAHYLSDLGGKLDMQPGSPDNPQPGTVARVSGGYNNMDHAYMVNAVQQFLKFKSGPSAGVTTSQPDLVNGNPVITGSSPGCPTAGNIVMSPNGYTSPFPVTPTITRAIDQGVDYSVPVGTPLRVIGNAQVMGVDPSWFSSQPYIWYQLTDPNGSLYKKCVYYAEQITGEQGTSAYDSSADTSLQSQIGHRIPAGTTIAYMATSGTHLEFGFADCATGATLAQISGGYRENSSTAAGVSFNKLMAALGVPSDSPYPVTLGSVAGMGYP
jgi:hypothetical protein